MAPDVHAQATLVPGIPPGPAADAPRTVSATRAARALWEPAEADPPLAPGAVIDGRYRVVRLVGEGGMGRVYETEHLFLRRRLALKLVRRDAGTGEAAARLLQEAVLAGKVPHATVVPVFDCAALPDGQVYVAMELLRGESLEAALLRPQPAQAVLPWLADVARGLAAAHRAGIVHRDVKPANVFLARTNAGTVQPKILDFGIAKLLPGLGDGAAEGVRTQAGALLGTPFYMAPERIRGEIGDGRADLYSFGVILYEALTGQVPFTGASFMEIVGRHLREPPLDPRQAAPGRAIPDALAELTLSLLRKEPAERPADGDAVAAALLAVGEREPIAQLWLGAGPQGATAPAEAVTQALAEMATQRLAGAGSAEGATQRLAGAGSAEGATQRLAGAGSAEGATQRLAGFSGSGAPRRTESAGPGSSEHVLSGMSDRDGAIGHVETNMSESARGCRRMVVLAVGVAAAGLLAAWFVGGDLRASDPPGASDHGGAAEAERAPVERAEVAGPASGPGPAAASAGAPVGDPGAAGEPVPRGAEPEAGSKVAPASEPEAGPKAARGAEEAGETQTGARPEPDAGDQPAKAKPRGKKAGRKAGTTGPGPLGSGPKLKTDVYDE